MLKNYLKVAWKVLLRRKFFTFISLFGVSVTLLVLLVAAAFADNIFGARAPETRLDRTLGVYFMKMSGEHRIQSSLPGYKLLDQTVRDLPGVETVSIMTWSAPAVSYVGGERVTSFLKRADGAFFRIMDFQFLEGGPFTDEDEKNANFVAVINEATRKRFFGGAPALGKTIEIDAQRFRVVGVVPNVPIFRVVPFSDVYVPISTSKGDAWKRELLGNFMAILVAKDRGSLPVIRETFQQRLARVPLDEPKYYDKLTGGADTFFEAVGRNLFDFQEGGGFGAKLLLVIVVVMALFMLLPAINLVNINVSRILERASEIGVRKAFGASSGTLVGQFVVENVLLSFIGGAIGLVLAFVALAGISRSGLIPYARFTPSLAIFGYGLLIATFFGVVSGVYPAFKMSRLHPVEALRGRTR